MHQTCNLQYKIDKKKYKLLILFHNLHGYDSHVIIQAICRRHGRIDVILNNYERYQSFTIGRLKFFDLFQFLPSLLDSLTKELNINDFKYFTRFFPDATKGTLMLCKGAYPYEYVTSMKKFDKTALPPQSAFHNRLNEQPLSDVDYEHAQQVWSLFECQILCDYHNLYLHSDVYLLAEYL